MTETIKAIPTLYKGTGFKSRLEARFAEWLDERDIEWFYEQPFPNSKQGYTADFYLPEFSDKGLWIEVKPYEFRKEVLLFKDDVEPSDHPWILVDQENRGVWRYLVANRSFWGGQEFHFRGPCRMDLKRVSVDAHSGYVEMTFFPQCITYVGNL